MVFALTAREVREHSLNIAKQLGYAVTTDLPLLDEYDEILRSVDDVVDRMLGMYCLGAAAYGFDRGRASKWLKANTRADPLTPIEKRYLETGEGEAQSFRLQIEAIWALYWSCGFADMEFCFDRPCPKDLVARLPELKKEEAAERLRSRAILRDVQQVVQMADTAYCIDWAMTQLALDGKKSAGTIPQFAVRERRRAMDWLLENEDWDKLSLDT